MRACRPSFPTLVLLLVIMLLHGQAAHAQQEGNRQQRSLLLPGGGQAADAFSKGVLSFIGNATVLIQYAGFTILTDPNFLHKGDYAHLGYGLKSQRLTEPAMALDQLPPIDLVLLSHLHGDHFDQMVQQQLSRDLPVVTTPHAARELAEMGFTRRFPLDTWDTLTVRKGDAILRITSMPARHGPPVLSAALPETMGSMLDFVDSEGRISYRAYITGDTLMHDAISDIPRRYPDVDLALLHLGGTTLFGMVMVTMDAAQGVEMMRVIAPRHAIPVHYNDYDVFQSPIEDFQRQASEARLRDRLTFLKHGERYEFTARRGRP